MKKLFACGVGAGLLAVAALAAEHEHAYEKAATSRDLMAYVQKPAMDSLAAMKKAGGPQNIDDWKLSNASASLLVETTQLMMMGGRVKDEAWENGAQQVIDAGKQAMTASMRQDVEGWNQALAGLGQGCRACHTVHKPKKQ